MTADANDKVTYKEILVTLFLKLLPSILAVVLISEFVSHFSASLGIRIPDILFNLVFTASLLIALKLTAGNMLSRLVEEKNKE